MKNIIAMEILGKTLKNGSFIPKYKIELEITEKMKYKLVIYKAVEENNYRVMQYEEIITEYHTDFISITDHYKRYIKEIKEVEEGYVDEKNNRV